MPHEIVAERARLDLERRRLWLLARNSQAAQRASKVIARQFGLLQNLPEIGRPMTGATHLRELIICLGNSGYIALYRHAATADAVYLLAFRHQREAGYRPPPAQPGRGLRMTRYSRLPTVRGAS